MSMKEYIPELVTLIVGAVIGWFPNRKRNKADIKQIEVEVLEKCLQILNKDVVEPLRERYVLLQDDFKGISKKLKKLQDAIDKIHTCRHINYCPVNYELQRQQTSNRSAHRERVTHRQREPTDREDNESDSDSFEDGEDGDLT